MRVESDIALIRNSQNEEQTEPVIRRTEKEKTTNFRGQSRHSRRGQGEYYGTGDRTLRTRTATSYHVTTPENVWKFGRVVVLTSSR